MNLNKHVLNVSIITMLISFASTSAVFSEDSYHLVDGYKFKNKDHSSTWEEPIFHLKLKHNPKEDWIAAGRDLRDSAAFMRLQAKHATEKGRRALHASIKHMENLADSIEKKKEVAVEKVENAYAKAMLALAHHHHSRGLNAWNRKELDKAERELTSAAHYLKSASRWAKQDMKEAINTTATEVEGFYQQVLLREGVSLERIGNRIEAFDKDIGLIK